MCSPFSTSDNVLVFSWFPSLSFMKIWWLGKIRANKINVAAESNVMSTPEITQNKGYVNATNDFSYPLILVYHITFVKWNKIKYLNIWILPNTSLLSEEIPSAELSSNIFYPFAIRLHFYKGWCNTPMSFKNLFA